ncbi:MAG: hypothetical protein C0594_08425 [Marinilabiliales bacterium]|nr:MAG: hypothetical protein C0594_08425 [Marinilabiliales bacterium]
MKLSKYINNISGLQLFQLLRFGVLLLISIVFAKSGMKIHEIGKYEYFILIAGALCYFWVHAIINTLLPLYKNNKSFDKKERKSPVLFNSFFIITILSILAAIFVYTFKNIIAQYIGDNNAIPYLNLLLLYITFGTPSNLIEYIFLLQNKPHNIIGYGLVSFTLHLLLVAGPALLGMDIYYCLAGLVIISGARFIYLVLLVIKYSQLKLSGSFIKEHSKLAFPLMLSFLVSGSAQYIDGILVSSKYDASVFAVFRYGAKELPLVAMLANAFSVAMLSGFSSKEEIIKSLATIKRKSKQLSNLLFPVTIILLISSKWLYPLVFSDKFSESAAVFNVYLLLIISRLVFPQTILIGSKKTKIIFIVSVIELIINVGLSLIFIQYWGIIGVAYATFIAFALEKTILTILVQSSLNIKAKQYIAWPSLLFYSVITLTTYIIVTIIG